MVFNLKVLIAALRSNLEREAAFCKSPNSKIVLSLPQRRRDKDALLKQFSSDAGYYLRFYSTSAKGKKLSSSRSTKDKDIQVVTEPQYSLLHPPKPPPSVWQIYFTDWLHRLRYYSKPDKKLNVAQEAKEAAIAYSELSEEDKESLKARAKLCKEQYEAKLADWKRTLTPADIEHENAFRTAQRKSGKSRRKNISDPNAPKRPMSAYLYFLQHIRADNEMTKNVFGDVTETTRQSVLAAAKWRSMTDEEKQPYFDQADSDKLRYEAERKVYEESTRHSSLSVFYYPSGQMNEPEEKAKQHSKL